MGEWKLFERVWKPPMRWRVKQAWNLIRRGRFDIRMHYQFSEDESLSVLIDGNNVGEVSHIGEIEMDDEHRPSELENEGFEVAENPWGSSVGYGYESETTDPHFVPQPPNRITAFDTYGPHEWPKITPVNTDLALVWKVLIILATFPWWIGMTWLVRVGW